MPPRLHENASPAERARFVRDRIPPAGLFAGLDWRIAPAPFPLRAELVAEIESLGRVLLQFNRAVNLLYRLSVAGKQPDWIARWLELGKPADLVQLQRSAEFKNELPRVIRPDLLLTDAGLAITELDSVPGGIGLTAWLNQTYSLVPPFAAGAERGSQALNAPSRKVGLAFADDRPPSQSADRLERSRADGKKRERPGPGVAPGQIIGGAGGMIEGFASIFGGAPRVHVIVSEESSTYRPEMEWLCSQLNRTRSESSDGAPTRAPRFQVCDTNFTGFHDGDAVYRFFELFDAPNVANAQSLFDAARQRRIRLTPPPKSIFEEKMLFALLWNRNLRGFWRQELGESFFNRLLKLVPYTWVIDPTPLPPQGAIPELNLTDWRQLKALSHRERELILKVSGFSETAWGARGVYLGSDLSVAEWSEAVDLALRCYDRSPFVLQRYNRPKLVESAWFDFSRNELVPMPGRARLCPYYFVGGEGDAARARLGGILATICPADKKIIHGMRDSILAPCMRA